MIVQHRTLKAHKLTHYNTTSLQISSDKISKVGQETKKLCSL